MSRALLMFLPALALTSLVPATKSASAADGDVKREIATIRVGPPGLTAAERLKFELGPRLQFPAGLMAAHPLRLGHAPPQALPAIESRPALAPPTEAELAKLRTLEAAPADAIAAPTRSPRRWPGDPTKPAGFGTSVRALTPGLTAAERAKLENAGIRPIDGGPRP